VAHNCRENQNWPRKRNVQNFEMTYVLCNIKQRTYHWCYTLSTLLNCFNNHTWNSARHVSQHND